MKAQGAEIGDPPKHCQGSSSSISSSSSSSNCFDERSSIFSGTNRWIKTAAEGAPVGAIVAQKLAATVTAA